jgi:hypothetical protein
MADVKISGLPASTTPLAGTEVLPVVQGGVTKQVSVANLTTGRSVSVAGLTNTTNLDFTGTANRITGDFSNATLANRVSFQNSILDASTTLTVIPNGTSTIAQLQIYANSNPANASRVSLAVNGTTGTVNLNADRSGSGTYLPFTIQTNGAERLRVFTSGGVSIGNTTDPGATNLSVTGSVKAATMQTGTGTTASTASGVPVSLFSVDTVPGMYLIYVWFNSGVPNAYQSFATVTADFQPNSSRIVANNATLMAITLVSGVVYATQTSGGAQAITYSYIRIN